MMKSDFYRHKHPTRANLLRTDYPLNGEYSNEENKWIQEVRCMDRN